MVSGVEKHCLIVIKSEDGKYSASYGRKINFDRKQEKCFIYNLVRSFGDFRNSV